MQSFRLKELYAQSVGDARHRLDLQFAELAAVALETVGPDMRAGLGRDQLGVDRDRLADTAHAAFDDVAHAEFAPHLLGADRLALVGQCGGVGDDETVGEIREVGGQVVAQAVGEIVLFEVAAQVCERQNDDRQARRAGEPILR